MHQYENHGHYIHVVSFQKIHLLCKICTVIFVYKYSFFGGSGSDIIPRLLVISNKNVYIVFIVVCVMYVCNSFVTIILYHIIQGYFRLV